MFYSFNKHKWNVFFVADAILRVENIKKEYLDYLLSPKINVGILLINKLSFLKMSIWRLKARFYSKKFEGSYLLQKMLNYENMQYHQEMRRKQKSIDMTTEFLTYLELFRNANRLKSLFIYSRLFTYSKTQLVKERSQWPKILKLFCFIWTWGWPNFSPFIR